jgi:hypothetical protein
MMEKIQESTARMTKRMISHFPIVQATFPKNPSNIKITAMIMKMIPIVKSQLAIQVMSS